MNILVDRQTLCEAVTNLTRAVSTKATIPVLEGILMEAKDGRLKLTAYNLDLGMKKEIEATVKEEGTVVLNAKILGEMLRRLNGNQVSLSDDDKMQCKIECNHAVFEIMGLKAADFPELPEIDESTGVEMPSDMLKDMVRQTIFSVAQGENARPILTGLLFDIHDNEIKMVGVDGYRLAVRKERLSYNGSIRFVAAGKAVGEAVKIVRDDEKTVTLNVGKRHFSITVDGYTIISRIIDGEFFNYEKVMSPSYKTVVTANAKDMISIVERISLVINDQLNIPVRCLMHKHEMIFSCNTTVGKAIDSCDCEIVNQNGEELEIGFNSRYLMDALRATETDEVTLNCNDPLAPMLILPKEGDAFMYMVMPMRLKSEE